MPRQPKDRSVLRGGRRTPSASGVARWKAAEMRATSAENRLRCTHAVTQALAAARDLEEASSSLLAAVGDCLAWAVGTLWEVDAKARVLRCVDVWRRDPKVGGAFEATTRATRFPPGVGLPGRVWSERRAQWVSDVVKDGNFPRAPVAEADGLHGAFAFPLTVRAEPVGVMEFFSPEIREPDEDLLGMFTVIGGVIGTFIERRNAERRLRLILEKSLDAYVSISAEGVVLEWNPSAERMFGWSAAEAVGRLLAELIIPESHRRAHAQGLARFLDTGEGLILGAQIETTALRKDGEEFPVELAVTPVRVGDVWTFHGFVRDITTRKRIERALRSRDPH